MFFKEHIKHRVNCFIKEAYVIHAIIINTISRSGFGLFSQLHYQSKEVRLREGDILVSLSDGVYSHINESEILSHFLKASLTLEERADILFNLSNERGNIDNQSCMVLEF